MRTNQVPVTKDKFDQVKELISRGEAYDTIIRRGLAGRTTIAQIQKVRSYQELREIDREILTALPVELFQEYGGFILPILKENKSFKNKNHMLSLLNKRLTNENRKLRQQVLLLKQVKNR